MNINEFTNGIMTLGELIRQFSNKLGRKYSGRMFFKGKIYITIPAKSATIYLAKKLHIPTNSNGIYFKITGEDDFPKVMLQMKALYKSIKESIKQMP
ncbi:MAG: hypothetical protein ACTSWX_00825 [Promethearchaeota archaeon]